MIGDEAQLYRSLATRLEQTVRVRVHAPPEVIEDACHHAWTQLINQGERVNRDAMFSWLATTAVRHAWKLNRRERRDLSLEAAAGRVGELQLPTLLGRRAPRASRATRPARGASRATAPFHLAARRRAHLSWRWPLTPATLFAPSTDRSLARLSAFVSSKAERLRAERVLDGRHAGSARQTDTASALVRRAGARTMTVLATADIRGFYDSLGVPLPDRATQEAAVKCFASPESHRHGDRSPSASVSLLSGAWCCHACGARGGAYDAALARGHTPRGAIELMITHGLIERRSSPGLTPVGSSAIRARPRGMHPLRPRPNRAALKPRMRTSNGGGRRSRIDRH